MFDNLGPWMLQYGKQVGFTHFPCGVVSAVYLLRLFTKDHVFFCFFFSSFVDCLLYSSKLRNVLVSHLIKKRTLCLLRV